MEVREGPMGVVLDFISLMVWGTILLIALLVGVAAATAPGGLGAGTNTFLLLLAIIGILVAMRGVVRSLTAE